MIYKVYYRLKLWEAKFQCWLLVKMIERNRRNK